MHAFLLLDMSHPGGIVPSPEVYIHAWEVHDTVFSDQSLAAFDLPNSRLGV